MRNFTGLEYIKIAIANGFGLDKLTWDARINWIDTEYQESMVEALPSSDIHKVRKAVKALEDAKNGVPTGFIMGLDSCASGIQILSVLIGCRTTAANVNLTNTGKREDIYQKVTDTMDSLCGKEITRNMIKKPVMTSCYGSKAQPESVFGKGTPELQAFHETLAREIPGALEVMDDLLSCWDRDAYNYSWTLPDGHVASVDVTELVDKRIEIDELNHTSFTYRMEINKPSTNGIPIIANVTQSVDGYIVREMIRRAHKQGFVLLTVHDDFMASPNNMNKVRANYIDIMCEIADSNLLENIISELLGTKVKVTKRSNNLSKYIRESEYALS